MRKVQGHSNRGVVLLGLWGLVKAPMELPDCSGMPATELRSHKEAM